MKTTIQSKKLKAACFFEGAGGTSLGLKNAGIEVVYANEINKIYAESYRLNHGDHMQVGDIKQVKGTDLPKEIDIAVCTAPCQSFSMAGKRAMSDPRDDLTLEFIRILKERQDIPCFIFENVKGITMGEKRQVLDAIELEFKKLGFHITKEVYNTFEYGVPQNRRRLIMVGMRNKKHNFSPVVPDFDPTQMTRKCVIAQAKAQGKQIDDSTYLDAKNFLRILIRKNCTYKKFKEYHDENKPFNTITASSSLFGCENNYILEQKTNTRKKCGYDEVFRYPSLPEAMIAQTFPLDYQFTGTKTQKYMQVGNAVPPKFAEAIGKGVIRIFEEIDEC